MRIRHAFWNRIEHTEQGSFGVRENVLVLGKKNFNLMNITYTIICFDTQNSKPFLKNVPSHEIFFITEDHSKTKRG